MLDGNDMDFVVSYAIHNRKWKSFKQPNTRIINDDWIPLRIKANGIESFFYFTDKSLGVSRAILSIEIHGM